VFDRVEQLLLERRLGTAVELIKAQAEAAPDNFDLWLRYAEAYGHHCGNPNAAERIVERMERSGHFKKAQLKKAQTRLNRWRKKHAIHQDRW
jgi:predicted Zn-dependent protease